MGENPDRAPFTPFEVLMFFAVGLAFVTAGVAVWHRYGSASKTGWSKESILQLYEAAHIRWSSRLFGQELLGKLPVVSTMLHPMQDVLRPKMKAVERRPTHLLEPRDPRWPSG